MASLVEKRTALQKRVEAGGKILQLEQRDLKKVAERFAEVVIFTGSEKDARKLTPTLFEEWQAREGNVRATDKMLEKLERKLVALDNP